MGGVSTRPWRSESNVSIVLEFRVMVCIAETGYPFNSQVLISGLTAWVFRLMSFIGVLVYAALVFLCIFLTYFLRWFMRTRPPFEV
jgi:hypothetical protein